MNGMPNRAALPVPPPWWEPREKKVVRDTVADSDEELEEIQARIMARRAECEVFEKAFLHSLETDPPKIECPGHPGTRMPIDVEASVKKSWDWLTEHGERKRRFVLKLCPACELEIKDARRREWMLRAGVPENLIDCSVENWTPKNAVDGASYKIVQEYARKTRGMLVLISEGYGCGKTHLAVGILRNRGDGVFRKQSVLLSQFRAGYGNGTSEKIQERMSKAKLLVLDEIGLSVGGKDELPLLHDILDARYAAGIPTVLTGNMRNPKDLATIFGDRMMDRMSEYIFAVVKLTAPSERPSRNNLRKFDQ